MGSSSTFHEPSSAEEDRLIEAFARGVLDESEFEARLERLPCTTPSRPTPALRRQVRSRCVSVFGESVCRTLRPAETTFAYAGFGAATLDFGGLSEAEDLLIHVRILLGSVKLIVPRHTEVDLQGAAVLGEFKDRRPRNGDIFDPVRRVRVRGLVLMGNVEVYEHQQVYRRLRASRPPSSLSLSVGRARG